MASAVPDTMSIRDINRLKHKITFGNISSFYHAVSTSLSLAEGIVMYGFENSLEHLLNQRNWNLETLGGHETPAGEIICDNKPRVSIYQLFTPKGYEIHCIPWIENREFDMELAYRPGMDFKQWNPSSMKVVYRVHQLHKFIEHYFDYGDEADLALIKAAHSIAETFIETHLQPQFNTQKVFGVSVKSYFDFVQKKLAAGETPYLPQVYNISGM